jgi:two-component system, sensor histidine kinase and response regulator
VLALVMLPTVSLLLLAALSAWRTALDNEAHVVEQRVTLARSIAQATTSMVSGNVSTLKSLALTGAITDPQDESAIQDFLERVVSANPSWEGLSILGPDGGNIASAFAAPRSVDLGDRPYFQQVLATGQPVVSPGLIGRTTGSQVVVAAVPVQLASGESGVLVASLKTANLAQALNRLYGGPGFEIVVVDQEGKALVHPDPATAQEMRPLASRPEVADVLSGTSGSKGTRSPGGVEQLTAYAPLSDLGWGVLVSQPVAIAFSPARRQLIIEWGLLTTTAALTSAFAWFLSGRLSRVYGLQRIATGQARAAAEQLSRQLGFTSAITRSLGEGVYAIDQDGRLTFMNPAAERMLGWKEQELLGKFAHGLIHSRRSDGSAMLGVARVGGTLQEDDEVFARRDGSLIPVAYTASPIVVNGVVVGAVVAFHDIAARKQSEAALRDAARMREEFLAMVSHELRTPLTAVLGYADILLRQRHGTLTERQQRHASGIRDAAHRQLALVNDLLDVSKLEAGKVDVALAPVDPRAVVARAAGALQVIAAQKGVQLRVDLPDPPEPLPRVLADEDRLHQILVNLLANAIKFTPRDGVVTLGAGLVLETARPTVAFRVTDSGIGIAPEHLAHIWDRFYQADSSSTRRFGGTGLGLTIVKRLTELHGGHVQAASPGAGQGATFTVWIPVAPLPPVDAAPDGETSIATGARRNGSAAEAGQPRVGVGVGPA